MLGRLLVLRFESPDRFIPIQAIEQGRISACYPSLLTFFLQADIPILYALCAIHTRLAKLI